MGVREGCLPSPASDVGSGEEGELVMCDVRCDAAAAV